MSGSIYCISQESPEKWTNRIYVSLYLCIHHPWASLVAQMVKNLPEIQETWVQSLGWEDPLEVGMATHSSIFAWRIPWTEESGRLQSTGLQRIRHDWAIKHIHHISTHLQSDTYFQITDFGIVDAGNSCGAGQHGGNSGRVAVLKQNAFCQDLALNSSWFGQSPSRII